MDYSLFLVTENLPGDNGKDERSLDSRNVLIAPDEKEIYHIGIIDYLQEWNLAKKGEVIAKKIFRGVDTKQLSAIQPINY